MITSDFGYTNTANATVGAATPVALGIKNYALIQDDPTECVLSNVTSPIDQGELLSFKCQNVDKVTTSQKILYPASVQNGIQYVVKLEDILKLTSSTDSAFRVDLPIVAYLTIRHPKSSYISSEMISAIVKRLIGACQDDTGAFTFENLMRSALKPTTLN